MLERGYQSLAAQANVNPGVVNSDDFIMELFNLRNTYVREGLLLSELELSAKRREVLEIEEANQRNRYNALEQELRQARTEMSILNNRFASTNPTTPQMIQARGNQHVEAGPNTHVHSFSYNELILEGAGHSTITGLGGVDIDVGAVTASECNENLSRNVTVNQANSLTVAPGIVRAYKTVQNLRWAKPYKRPQKTSCAHYLQIHFKIPLIDLVALAEAIKIFLKNYNTQDLD